MSMRTVVTAGVVAVILVAAGAAGALVMRGEQVPAGLMSAQAPTVAATEALEFVDERTVQVTFTQSTPEPLLLHATGTVTVTRCRPGRTIRSGSVPLEVNDEPVIALRTEVPPYRDLREGATGRDVKALQRELSRLGYRTSTSGTFNARTVSAVKRLKKALGYPKPDGALPLAQLLWLPGARVTPSSCAVKLGATVSAGAPLGESAARLVTIRVKALPSDLAPGGRTLTVFGASGPVGADGSATAEDFLARVSATQEFRAQSAAKSTDPVTATLALSRTLSTVKVPPASIFDMNGSHGCIQSGSRTVPVVVVGSGLGASVVLVQGKPPDTVNLGPAITASRCA